MSTCLRCGEPEQDGTDEERRGSTAPDAGEFVHVDFTPAVAGVLGRGPEPQLRSPAVGRGCWITSWVLDGRPELPVAGRRRTAPARARAFRASGSSHVARGSVRTIVRPSQGTGAHGGTTTFV